MVDRNFHYRSLDNYSFLPSIKDPTQHKRAPRSNKSTNFQAQLNIQSPYMVSDRQEWNQQSFVVKKKRKQRQYPLGEKRIDNELEADFPVHKKFDYVQSHALGFKGKDNVDLFKFYYRLYMKNKFYIQKGRRYKKDFMETIREEDQKADEILSQKRYQIRSSIIQNSFEELSQIPGSSRYHLDTVRKSQHNSLQKSQQTEQSQMVDQDSLEIKNYIIEQGLNQIIEYEKLIAPTVNDAIPQKIIMRSATEKHNYSKKLKIKKVKLPSLTINMSVKNVELDYQSNEMNYSQSLDIQQIFIDRIMQKILSFGINRIDKESLDEFKSIIGTRKQQLSDMQRGLEIEQLLKLKKKIYEQEIQQSQREQYLLDELSNQKLTTNGSTLSIVQMNPLKQIIQQPFISIIPPVAFNLPKVKSQIQLKSFETLQSDSIEMIGPVNSPTSLMPKTLSSLRSLKLISKQQPDMEQNILTRLSMLNDGPVIDLTRQLDVNSLLSNRSSARKLNQPSIHSVNKSNRQSIHSQTIEQVQETEPEPELQPEVVYVPLHSDDKFDFTQGDNLQAKMNQLIEHLARRSSTLNIDYKKTFNELMGIDAIQNPESPTKLTQDLVSMLAFQNSGRAMLQTIMSNGQTEELYTGREEDAELQGILSAEKVSARHFSVEQVDSIVDLIRSRFASGNIPEGEVNEQLQMIEKQLGSYLKKEKKEVVSAFVSPPSVISPINILSPQSVKVVPKLQKQSFHQDEDSQGQSTNRKQQIKQARAGRLQDKDYIQFYEDANKLSRHGSQQINSYNSKQKLFDQNKHMENLKKASIIQDDRKSIFLKAEHMNYAKNIPEVDTEMDFLQARLADHKNSKVALFSNFQTQILDNRKSLEVLHSDQDDEEANVKYILKKKHNQKTQFEELEEEDIIIPKKSPRARVSLQKSSDTNILVSPKGIVGSLKGTIHSPSITSPADSNYTPRDGFNPQKAFVPSKFTAGSPWDEQRDSASVSLMKNQTLPITKQYQDQNNVEPVSNDYIQMPQSNQEPISTQNNLSVDADENEEIRRQIEDDDQDDAVEDDENSEITEQEEFNDDIEQEQEQEQVMNTQTEDNEIIYQSENKGQSKVDLAIESGDQNINQNVHPIEPQILMNTTKKSTKQTKFQEPQFTQIKTNKTVEKKVKVPEPLQDFDKTEVKVKPTKIQQTASKKLINETPKVTRQVKQLNNQSDAAAEQIIDKPLKKQRTSVVAGETQKKPKAIVIKKPARNAKLDSNEDITSPASPDQNEDEFETVTTTKQKNRRNTKQVTLKKERPLTPLKKTNLKEELELLSKRNLSLKELKRMINNKIAEVGEADDETKYNVHRFQQRQNQLVEFQTQLKEIMSDAYDRGPDCSDVVVAFYDARNKYKEVTERDKTLKFSNQVKMDEEVQEESQIDMNDLMDDVEGNIQRLLTLAHQKILKETAEERRALFLYDSEQIKNLNQDSTIQQYGVEAKSEFELMQERLKNSKKKNLFRSSIIEIEELPILLAASQIQLNKLEKIKKRLKLIKKNEPSKFDGIMVKSIVIKNIESQDGMYLSLIHKKLI